MKSSKTILKCLFALSFFFFSFKSYSQWEPVPMYSSQKVNQILKVNKYFFLSNLQGVFRSEDGVEWKRITNSNHYYITSDNDTLFALETTWVEPTLIDISTFNLELDDNPLEYKYHDRPLVCYTRRILKSTDFGNSWTKMNFSIIENNQSKFITGLFIATKGVIFAYAGVNSFFTKLCDTCQFTTVHRGYPQFMKKNKKGDVLFGTNVYHINGNVDSIRLQKFNITSLKVDIIAVISKDFYNFQYSNDTLFAQKDGLYYSLDDGKNFIKKQFTPPSGMLYKHIKIQNGTFYFFDKDIYATNDFITWQTIKNPNTLELKDLEIFGKDMFITRIYLNYSGDYGKTWAIKNKGLKTHYAFSTYLLKANNYLVANGQNIKSNKTDVWQMPNESDNIELYNLHDVYYNFSYTYKMLNNKTYGNIREDGYLYELKTKDNGLYWQKSNYRSSVYLAGFFDGKLYYFNRDEIQESIDSGKTIKSSLLYFNPEQSSSLINDSIFIMYNNVTYQFLLNIKGKGWQRLNAPQDFMNRNVSTKEKLLFENGKVISIRMGPAGDFTYPQYRISFDTCKTWKRLPNKTLLSTSKNMTALEVENGRIVIVTKTTSKPIRSEVYLSDYFGSTCLKIFEDKYGREVKSVVFFNDSLYIGVNPYKIDKPYVEIGNPIYSNFPDETIYKIALSKLNAASDIPSTQGMVFQDVNNDGIRDASDKPLLNYIVKRTSEIALTQPDGWYDFLNFTGKGDTLKVITPNRYISVNPPFILTTGFDTARHFAVTIPNVQDFSIKAECVPLFRPGFQNNIKILVKNEGLKLANPKVQLSIDKNVKFINAVPPITSRTDSSLTWQLDYINSNDTRFISVSLMTPTTVPINTFLQFTSVINPIDIDSNKIDNIDVLKTKVVGSFDPNDKLVEPKTYTPDNVAKGLPLNYTIRFQNTGNYPASFVVVEDTLGDYFDLGTFRFISSSHPCTYEYKGKGIIRFIFSDVNLPDSISNEAGSHGFVKYSIVPKTSLKKGDFILNTAHIYFDYNSPVITPTSKLGITTPTSIWQVPKVTERISIYPNPAENIITIGIDDDQFKVGFLSIYDLSGRLMFTKSISDKTGIVDVSHLSVGEYICMIKSLDNKVFVNKFVKVQ